MHVLLYTDTAERFWAERNTTRRSRPYRHEATLRTSVEITEDGSPLSANTIRDRGSNLYKAVSMFVNSFVGVFTADVPDNVFEAMAYIEIKHGTDSRFDITFILWWTADKPSKLIPEYAAELFCEKFRATVVDKIESVMDCASNVIEQQMEMYRNRKQVEEIVQTCSDEVRKKAKEACNYEARLAALNAEVEAYIETHADSIIEEMYKETEFKGFSWEAIEESKEALPSVARARGFSGHTTAFEKMVLLTHPAMKPLEEWYLAKTQKEGEAFGPALSTDSSGENNES